MNQPLRILHTSDWHLGRRLYGHTRYDEFSAFLNWLYDCLHAKHVDVLIVAGDIFDTMTPSNRAQALYYEFLGKVANSGCDHVIVVAGNHDSPSLLDAPKQVLKALSVSVVGTATDNIADEVITLTKYNKEQQKNLPYAIIQAVPYLRDKDVRQSVSGESSGDKNQQLVNGITSHYQTASSIANQRQADIFNDIGYHVPIIATGHLFASGGKTTTDDGVRDLYVGSLGQIGTDVFDANTDYVALGHLHVPQLVGKQDHIRYSGSPIAMGFGEATQQKQVVLVEFTPLDNKSNSTKSVNQDNNDDSNAQQTKTDADMIISTIDVPCFHQLAQVKGNIASISKQIAKLKELNKPIWLEVVYESIEIATKLSEKLAELVENTELTIIKIKNAQTYERVLAQGNKSESLQELTQTDVFTRCLDLHDIEESQRDALVECFEQVVYEIEHDDVRAE